MNKTLFSRIALIFLILAASATLGFVANRAQAQGMTPIDSQEKACFEAVSHAVEKAGYAAVVPVGHGTGEADSFFAMTATRGAQGILLIAVEPKGHETVHPLEIENAQTPADIGIHGIRFEPFLGTDGLYDVVVAHRPFRLEMSYESDRHHVLRRQGNLLVDACDFDGDTVSSYSKGIGSSTTKRTVTVEKVSGSPTFQFAVKGMEETTQQSGQAADATVTRKEIKMRYELPASGTCKELKN